MAQETWSIYLITNIINTKIYIGQSLHPIKRWQQHKLQANQQGLSYHLYNSMNKYGIDNFSFKVIDFAFTQSQADCIEFNLIEFYNTRNPQIGYNKKTGGQGKHSVGHPWTDEQKNIHSDFMLNNPNDGQFTSERMLGNQINTGRKHTDEWKREMSEFMLNNPNSGSFKKGQKPLYTQKGKSWKLVDGKRIYSDKIETGLLPLPKMPRVYGHSQETKNKIAASNTGKHPSKETRKKQSDAAKKRSATAPRNPNGTFNWNKN